MDTADAACVIEEDKLLMKQVCVRKKAGQL